MWARSAPIELLWESCKWSSSFIVMPSTAANVVVRTYVSMHTSLPMAGEYPEIGSMRSGDGSIMRSSRATTNLDRKQFVLYHGLFQYNKSQFVIGSKLSASSTVSGYV